jgi:hypothetical protein
MIATGKEKDVMGRVRSFYIVKSNQHPTVMRLTPVYFLPTLCDPSM